ncbi:MAG: hypothetical protein Ta2G_07980 [Termitinemataceae bacterium]|nr:MAG: hypothetical protein Ta2G_07980 [Termitinemataceae bacterium]
MVQYKIAVSYAPQSTKKSLHDEGRQLLQMLDPGGCTLIKTCGNGRPYFDDRHADFNISHSKNAAAVIWSTAGRTAIDIQHIRECKNCLQIAKRAFSKNETFFLQIANSKDEMLQRFYKIWVLKEAAIKLQGLSVFNITSIPSFVNDNMEISVPYSKYILRKLQWKCGSITEEYMLAGFVVS